MNKKIMIVAVSVTMLFSYGCKTKTEIQPIKILEPVKDQMVSVQIGQGIFAKSEEVIIYMNSQKIIVNENGVLILNRADEGNVVPGVNSLKPIQPVKK